MTFESETYYYMMDARLPVQVSNIVISLFGNVFSKHNEKSAGFKRRFQAADHRTKHCWIQEQRA